MQNHIMQSKELCSEYGESSYTSPMVAMRRANILQATLFIKLNHLLLLVKFKKKKKKKNHRFAKKQKNKTKKQTVLVSIYVSENIYFFGEPFLK